MTHYYGSIEAGGTKFVLAVGNDDFEIIDKHQLPTTTPEATLAACSDYFAAHPVEAIGIGSFGPIDIDRASATYGHILATPKPGWAGVDIVGRLQADLGLPIVFTTDVNASAYGEYIAGAGKDLDSLVYITVGTGIGGGAIQTGRFVGGTGHAEIGHTLIVPQPEDDYAGTCPFHHNRCVEGMAAGPSIQGRRGIPGEKVPRTDPVFDYISDYIAQLLYNTYLELRPAKMILGGSVLSAAELPKIRAAFKTYNHGYIATPPIDELIVLSQMPDNTSATVGDFALARQLVR